MRIRYTAKHNGHEIGAIQDVDIATAHKLAAAGIAEYVEEKPKTRKGKTK